MWLALLAPALAATLSTDVLATDINPNAIASVERELARHPAPVRPVRAELLGEGPSADLVVFNPPWIPGDVASPLDAALVYAPGLFERFFDQAAAKSGDPEALVMKNPELTRHFPRLARWFPEARFVVMVRDPRDTVASMIKVAEKQRANGVQSGLTQVGRNMQVLGRRYKSYYIPVLNHFNALKDRLTLLRYEQLVQQPAGTAAQLSEALDIPLSAEVIASLDDRQEAVPYFNAERRQQDGFFNAFWSPLYEKGLSSSRAGRFRETLSPAEISALEQTLADFNQLLPYWQPQPQARAAR